MSALRVLQVVRPAAGGIRRHVLSLLEADPPIGLLRLAAPAEFLSDLPSAIPANALFPLDISSRLSPLRDFRAARHLARIAAGECDLIHAHGLRAAWVMAPAAKTTRIPCVFTAHNLVPKSVVTRAALKIIGGQVSKVIAISEAVAAGLRDNGVPSHKIVVIPNGINIASYEGKSHTAAARAALGISPGSSFVVGCIARLSCEKGVDILLQAARLQPQMQFLIAGDGPERAALSRNLPSNARLLGKMADVRVLLSALDIIAIPSRQEGQGIAALEAMAAGVPIVASRVGGLAEMLTDGKTALLVPPDNAAALAAALTILKDDPVLGARLVETAGILVREQYDIRKIIEAILSVYRDLA